MSSEKQQEQVEVTQEETKEVVTEQADQQTQNVKEVQLEQDEEFKVNRSKDEKTTQSEAKEQNDCEITSDKEENEEENGEQEQNQEADDNEDNENDEEEEIPESEKTLEKALEYKEKANKYFYEQYFDDAIEYYYKALKYCPKDETKQQAVLNSNLAICYLKKNDYETVIEYSSQSIKLDPTFKKPYLNRITAYEKTEKLEEAIEDLKELEKLDPSDKQIKTKIFVMQKDLEKLNEKRKTEVLSGLKDLGNTILGKFGLNLDNFKLNKNENGSFNIQFQK